MHFSQNNFFKSKHFSFCSKFTKLLRESLDTYYKKSVHPSSFNTADSCIFLKNTKNWHQYEFLFKIPMLSDFIGNLKILISKA